MPRYRYSAFGADGTLEEGAIDANSEAEALERLAALHLTVTDLSSELNPQPARLFRGRPRLALQADLADQLSVLFAASLPAPKVAEIVAASNSDPSIKRHFQRMGQLMADGADFADAMAQASGVLSPLFSILASIGQRAGKPGMQMPQLATTLRRQERLVAQIGGALVYPAILLAGGIGILLLMSFFLAPRLEVIFTSVNSPVPRSIATFTRIGEELSVWGLPLFFGLMAISLWGFRLIRRPSQKARAIFQGFPLIGPVLRDAALARIVRAIQLMLDAGMPLAPAISQAASSFGDEPLSEPFRLAALALEDGALASSVLSADAKLPILLRELFQIGEETNSLPRVLNSVAMALEDGVERKLQRLMTLLTPALTLSVGAIIAAIVSSVMGAVLSVNDLAL